MAAWADVSYNVGNFDAFTLYGSQAWTVDSGDVTTFAYRYIGKTMQVAFVIAGSSVLDQSGSTPPALLLTIPQGRRATRLVVTPIRVQDNGTYGVGYAVVGPSESVIGLYLTSAFWSASTNNSGVWGQIEFEVDAVNDVFTATGGTITTANGYTRHTFTGTDSFVVTQGQATSVDYLIVGGGGGGGGDDAAGAGGGGGGGQVRIGSVIATQGTYTVTVGAGGAAGIQSATGDGGTGVSSSFYGVTAVGGSGGAAGGDRDGVDGTVGGGGGGLASGGAAGDGTLTDGGAGSTNAGGGGGGAEGTGVTASSGAGGAGGVGRLWSPTATRYGGGGGGGGLSTGGSGTDGGGVGRGGSGAGTAGTANRGGGGGGARFGAVGGAGGSGIVIVQYPTP